MSIMKFATSLIITALLSFAVGLYLPWWSLAIAAFAVAALIPQKPWMAWLSGFLALFLLWGGLATWIDIRNLHILSGKVAQLLPVGGSVVLLILFTAFIGALVAGFACEQKPVTMAPRVCLPGPQSVLPQSP